MENNRGITYIIQTSDLHIPVKKEHDKFKDILDRYSNNPGNISYEKNSKALHIRYGGKQVKKLLDLIYNNSNIHINRKYFKYQLICRTKIG